MNDNQTPILLPCPFCGGKASWIEARQREDGMYYPAECGCSKCGIFRYGDSSYRHGGFATEDDIKKSMLQAISRWNTRFKCESQADNE